MNEVYLTGKLVAAYVPEAPASQPKHLVYQLRVAHANAQKQIRYENFTVNAWRNLATWAEANLRIGMEVFVRGHLSQRQTTIGNLTEVTALRITPVLAIKTAPITSTALQSSTETTAADAVANQSETHVEATSDSP